MDERPARSGLHLAPASDRLALRGDPLALGPAVGLELPLRPCRATVAGPRAALWLGPDEWLLLGPPGTLEPGIAVAGGVVVDIGHRQVGLELGGDAAAEMLAAGCPLDLHETKFPPGTCTRTVFAKAAVVLWRKRTDCFHLEVPRSYLGYVTGLLERAAIDAAFG